MVNPGWELYKSEIERLYIHENKTRAEVMQLMAREYSWNKSGAEYSKKFKEWGLRKNDQSRDDQWISRRVDKRKREYGKKSEVFVDGLQIHPKKIARSSYRKGFLSEYSRRAPSPSTPEGYVVATPTSPGMRVLWSNPLPWIRFTRLLQPSEHGDDSPSSSSALALNSSHNGKAVARGMNFELMQHLSTIIPWNKLQHRPGMHSASRTSAALSILMSEKEPGQHDSLSKALSTSGAGIYEHMSVVLYLISNNLTSSEVDFVKAMEQSDKLVLQIVRDTGWDDLKHLQILLSTHEPTAESIAEKLFAAALRQGNFDIVEKMLRSGMNPNGLIEDQIDFLDEVLFTPLQYVAVTGGSARDIELLMSHDADVNFSVKNNGKNALYYAIKTINETAIRVLLAQGAIVTQECASEAARIKPYNIMDFGLIENIIDIYFNQDVEMERDYTKTLEGDVLDNNLSIIERFLDKGADLNGLSSCPFGRCEHQTTLLGWAAVTENIEMVRLLLHVSVRKDPSLIRPPYISPLALAAGRGFMDICEVLLSGADNRGADEGEKTLLERAVPSKNLALCQLLINHGFKIDREPSGIQPCPSALMIAVQKGLVDIIDLLISSNARLNDVFDVEPGSILAAAVEVGDEAIINGLVSAGAWWIGLGVRRIGNLKTAIFLQNNGLLSDLVNYSGPKLLAEAILARDEDLARFLFDNNAHQERIKTTLAPKTPLQAAIQTDNLYYVRALLACGAQVTDDTVTEAVKYNAGLLPILLARFTGSAPTAVSAALVNGSRICLYFLREANVDLNGVPQVSHHRWNITGMRFCRLQSVLEIAAWKADDFIFKYILDWASSVQFNWSPKSVARALTLATFEENHDRIVELMRLDLDANCDITSHPSLRLGEYGFGEYSTYTPLQAAVKKQLVSVVRDLLVSKGADVDYLGEGRMRRTPLQHAVEIGNMEIVNLLLEHGANVNAPAAYDAGATALQLAAIKGYIGIARRLLEVGADVNQAGAQKNGRTALMGAAEYGRIDMLQMLLDEGALVVGEYEHNYYEAVELAEGQGHYAAARLLKSFKDSVE